MSCTSDFGFPPSIEPKSKKVEVSQESTPVQANLNTLNLGDVEYTEKVDLGLRPGAWRRMIELSMRVTCFGTDIVATKYLGIGSTSQEMERAKLDLIKEFAELVKRQLDQQLWKLAVLRVLEPNIKITFSVENQ